MLYWEHFTCCFLQWDGDTDFSLFSIQDNAITINALRVGIYVLECRPSSKQIWLTSPLSDSKGYVLTADISLDRFAY